MTSNQKYQRGTISRSSTDSSTAYLEAVWNGRLNLRDHERLGFAQFFYVFLNTHVESQLFALIDFRLESIREFAQTASHDLAYRLAHTKKGDSAHFKSIEADSHPAFYSLHKIIDEKYKCLKNAPIVRLMEMYDSIFPLPLKVIIGEELKRDLTAVTSMRNVFAHGRRISIDFEGPMGNGKAHLDSATLKEAAKRLQKANLLSKEEPISTQTYYRWERSIFSDKALLYFYNRILQIDGKLKDCSSSRREGEKISRLPHLPDLRQVS